MSQNPGSPGSRKQSPGEQQGGSGNVNLVGAIDNQFNRAENSANSSLNTSKDAWADLTSGQVFPDFPATDNGPIATSPVAGPSWRMNQGAAGSGGNANLVGAIDNQFNRAENSANSSLNTSQDIFNNMSFGAGEIFPGFPGGEPPAGDFPRASSPVPGPSSRMYQTGVASGGRNGFDNQFNQAANIASSAFNTSNDIWNNSGTGQAFTDLRAEAGDLFAGENFDQQFYAVENQAPAPPQSIPPRPQGNAPISPEYMLLLQQTRFPKLNTYFGAFGPDPQIPVEQPCTPKQLVSGVDYQSFIEEKPAPFDHLRLDCPQCGHMFIFDIKFIYNGLNPRYPKEHEIKSRFMIMGTGDVNPFEYNDSEYQPLNTTPPNYIDLSQQWVSPTKMNASAGQEFGDPGTEWNPEDEIFGGEIDTSFKSDGGGGGGNALNLSGGLFGGLRKPIKPGPLCPPIPPNEFQSPRYHFFDRMTASCPYCQLLLNVKCSFMYLGVNSLDPQEHEVKISFKVSAMDSVLPPDLRQSFPGAQLPQGLPLPDHKSMGQRRQIIRLSILSISTIFILVFIIPSTKCKSQFVQPLNMGLHTGMPYDIANIFIRPIAATTSVILTIGLGIIIFFGVITSPFGYFFGIPSRKYVLGGDNSTDDTISRISQQQLDEHDLRVQWLQMQPRSLDNAHGSGNEWNFNFPTFGESAFRLFPPDENLETDLPCSLLLICYAHGTFKYLPSGFVRLYHLFSKHYFEISPDHQKAIQIGLLKPNHYHFCENMYSHDCPKSIMTIMIKTVTRWLPLRARKK